MEDLLGTFKIKGDFHDLSKPWKDLLNKTIRENGVASFVGAVGSPYAWNLHAPSASLEKVGVRKSISFLIDLCGSQTVREELRKVEGNEILALPGAAGPPDLADDVNKMRYIISYFDDLTAPNDFKDGELTQQIDALKYSSTGRSNIYIDVVRFLDELQSYQDELQPQAKLSEYQLKDKCAKQLSNADESLLHSINTKGLRSALYTFAAMKNDLREIALNIKQNSVEHINTNTFAANTTVQTGFSEQHMRDVISQRNYEDRDQGRSSNSLERGRRRSDSRGRYSDSHSMSSQRDNLSQQSSRRYPSSDRFGGSSTSYGRPRSQSRDRSTSRSRSRPRYGSSSRDYNSSYRGSSSSNTSRGDRDNNYRGSRSSNSSVISSRDAEVLAEANRILHRNGRN